LMFEKLLFSFKISKGVNTICVNRENNIYIYIYIYMLQSGERAVSSRHVFKSQATECHDHSPFWTRFSLHEFPGFNW
jgi:hypothetical protein